MKKSFLLPVLSLFIIFTSFTAYAQDDPVVDNGLSFGIAASFGMINVWTRSGDDYWDKGVLTGTAFIMEKMFSDHVGIYSALMLERGFHKLSFIDPTTAASATPSRMKVEYVHWKMTIPACLLTSVNIGFFSLQFLAGPNLSHILVSELKPDNKSIHARDIVKLINYYGIGISGGINTRYRVGTYTDLFLGFLGDFTMTNMSNKSRGDGKTKDNMWDAKMITGVMLRASIFPSD